MALSGIRSWSNNPLPWWDSPFGCRSGSPSIPRSGARSLGPSRAGTGSAASGGAGAGGALPGAGANAAEREEVAGPSLTQRRRERPLRGAPAPSPSAFPRRWGAGVSAAEACWGHGPGAEAEGGTGARTGWRRRGKEGRGAGGEEAESGGGGGGRDPPAALGSPASVAAGACRHCCPGAEWHPGAQDRACSSACVAEGERPAGPSLRLAPPGRGACSPPAAVCREAGGP